MTSLRRREIDAIRAVVALPDDDWQPHDHDTLDAARLVLADLLRRHDLNADRIAKRPAQRQKLRAVSVKRAAEKPARAAVRELVLGRDRRCIPADRGMPGACQVYGGRQPLEVHEIAARGTHPGSHLDADLCVATCPRHHDDITNATGDLLELARALDLRRSPTT